MKRLRRLISSKAKKYESRVKYRESRMRFDCYGKELPEFGLNGDANLSIKPYMSIKDKAIKEHLKEVKTKVLLAVHNANVKDEDQIVNIGGATFTIHPRSVEGIVEKFKTNEW